MNKTNDCFLVSQKHRIDSFAQLGTAALVDATRIYPCICNFFLTSHLTGHFDLREAGFPACSGQVSDLVEGHFVDAPSVRENGIGVVSWVIDVEQVET